METLGQVDQISLFTLQEIQQRPGLIRYGEIKPLSLDEMLTTMGNTPIVCLEERSGSQLLAKIEGANPCGSIKARTSSWMLRDALENDLIDPEKGIVIASGGNFAIAMAAMCQVEKIPLAVSLLASAPEDFAKILTNLGANLIKESMTRDDRREITLDLADQGYCFLDQHNSPEALLAIGRTLAPEIKEQTQGKVTDIVAGFGTGMTVFGTSIFFRKRWEKGQFQQPVTVAAVEDDLSVLDFHLQALRVKDASTEEKLAFLEAYRRNTGRKFRAYQKKNGSIGRVVFYIGGRAVDDIPGIGISGLQPITQELIQMNLIDQVLPVIPEKAYEATRKLQTEGLYVGISSGAAFLAAQRLFQEKVNRDERCCVVAIFPDAGTLYNPDLYPNETPEEITQQYSYLFENLF